MVRIICFLMMVSLTFFPKLTEVNAYGIKIDGYTTLPVVAKFNNTKNYVVKSLSDNLALSLEFQWPKTYTSDGYTSSVDNLRVEWLEYFYQCGMNNHYLNAYTVYADGKLVVKNYGIPVNEAIDITAKKDLTKKSHGQTMWTQGAMYRYIDLPQSLRGKKIKIVFSFGVTDVKSLSPYDHVGFLNHMKKAFGNNSKYSYSFGVSQAGTKGVTTFENGNKDRTKQILNDFLKKKVTKSEPKYGGVYGLFGLSNNAVLSIDANLAKQYQGVSDFVERCYTKALGRKSDRNGKGYWIAKIMNAKNKKNEALNTASNGFFTSTEFLNKKTGTTEFVKICYRTFLGREAEAKGLKYWVDILNKKQQTRDQVLQGFANSTEFKNIMASYGIK